MKWNKERIQALLDSKPQAVIQALRALYARQLPEERGGAATVINGVGFSKHDAPFLCDMVRALNVYGGLTPRQMAVTRNKVKRYWRQLAEIANAKEPAVEPRIEAAMPEPAAAAKPCTCEFGDGEPHVACLGAGKCHAEYSAAGSW